MYYVSIDLLQLLSQYITMKRVGVRVYVSVLHNGIAYTQTHPTSIQELIYLTTIHIVAKLLKWKTK